MEEKIYTECSQVQIFVSGYAANSCLPPTLLMMPGEHNLQILKQDQAHQYVTSF